MEFDSKIVLVTGASRGIGRATALRFAEEGAKVAVHYHRDKSAANMTLNLLKGESHRIFQADLANASETEHLIKDVVNGMGGLDILVNNAGISEDHKLLEIDYDEWRSAWERTIAVNLIGPANLTYWAAKHMRKSGGGRIVNVSSRGAFRGEPTAPAYGASKAGLNAMSQSLARALAPHNIFICVVAPGWVETDMAAELLTGKYGDDIRGQSPLNRVARPDEVAKTVLFLASEGTDFLTGCIVDVNGASYLRS
ncbi:MAG: SDR family oxidoreductase [Anaerolineae bacterium]|nr:MAG: SDR family oxidoreductase [Anaerolineae bacterium]